MRTGTFAALAVLPLLAACAPEVEATLRTSDILRVTQDGRPFFVPALLRIPQSSEESCNRGLADLITNLGMLSPVTGKGSCISKDGDQFAEIETSMLVATIDSVQPAKSLFVLAVSTVDEVTYDLAFALNQPIDELVMALAANSNELQADFDPARFSFTLANDGAAGWVLTGNTVFIDGEPAVPGTAPVDLAAQASVRIAFSDVAAAYAEKGNSHTFARITAAP